MSELSANTASGMIVQAVSYKPSYRTAAGWVCVASLAYTYILSDLLNFVMQMHSLQVGRTVPHLDKPDAGLMIDLLIVLLGLSGIKSFDRKNGVPTQ